ncbi:hypothetical protein CR513_03317, partial [Mucuna pruriens]
MDQNTKDLLAQLSGFQITNSLGKYLGIPLTGQVPKRAEDFQYVIDKVHNKLARWKTQQLSLVRRLTLTKVVIQAIPVYPMMSTLGMRTQVWQCKLWCQVMAGMYGRNITDTSHVNVWSFDSPHWKGLTKMCPILMLCGLLGMENWFILGDHWVDADIKLQDFCLHNIPLHMDDFRVSDLATPEGSWNFELLNQMLPEALGLGPWNKRDLKTRLQHADQECVHKLVKVDLTMDLWALPSSLGLKFEPPLVITFGGGGTK